VASMDLAPLKLTGDEEADTRSNLAAELLRGKLGKLIWNGQTLGTLSVTEAWRNAASGVVATGTTYRVDPNPIKCIKAPCPVQYHEAKLNSTSSTTIYGFAGVHAAKLASALQGPDSLLVAGVNKTVKGKKVLEASQFWTRIVTTFSPTACATDADCATTVYRHLVSSAADCYCRICPSTAVNLAAADLFQASWEQHCTTVNMICPMVKCMATTAACTQGTCTVVGL